MDSFSLTPRREAAKNGEGVHELHERLELDARSVGWPEEPSRWRNARSLSRSRSGVASESFNQSGHDGAWPSKRRAAFGGINEMERRLYTRNRAVRKKGGAMQKLL